MNRSPLGSLSDYSLFVAQELDRSSVERSTVTIWSESPYTGIAEGEVFFNEGFRLRIRQELDFDARLITSYGYEVYKEEQRLFGMMTFRTRMIVPWPQRILITSTYLQTSSITVFPSRK